MLYEFSCLFPVFIQILQNPHMYAPGHPLLVPGGAELLSLRTVGEENLHSENTSEIIPEKNKTGKQGKTGGRLRPG